MNISEKRVKSQNQDRGAGESKKSRKLSDFCFFCSKTNFSENSQNTFISQSNLTILSSSFANIPIFKEGKDSAINKNDYG